MTLDTRHTAAAGSGLMMRPGRPEDASALSELAVRSKAFWGYSASFMRAVSAELRVDADQAARAGVCEVDGQLAGFHLLADLEPPTGAQSSDGARDGAREVTGELDMLFVDPQFIGSGLGRVLFEDARRAAIARGWTRMRIVADPHSQSFYERVGAVPVGERISGSVPGRILPLLELALRPSGVGGAGGSVRAGRATYWR